MNDRLKVSLCLGAALLCVGLAGAAVHIFSGRWERSAPTTLAGPALSLRLKDNGEVPGGAISASQRYGYVTGAVENPGMYQISDDARVYDLVKAAGGLRHDADAAHLNLAAPIRDGAHVHIKASPFFTDTKNKTSVSAKNTNRSGDSSKFHYVYVNTASEEDLSTLPGVGPALAKRIVEYRQNHGAFQTADDLLEVSGIGKAKLNAFRGLLRF